MKQKIRLNEKKKKTEKSTKKNNKAIHLLKRNTTNK